MSLAGRKILAFGSHSMVNFQPILDCFIPNFKLKYEDSKNINTDCVSTVIFNLHQIKRRAFYGTPGTYNIISSKPDDAMLKVQLVFKTRKKHAFLK